MGLPILANRSELYAEVAEPRGFHSSANAPAVRRAACPADAGARHRPGMRGRRAGVGSAQGRRDRVKVLVAGGVGSDPSAISEDDAAELAVWCRNITVRDIAWASWTAGTHEGTSCCGSR
jgi:hypothetical protein